MKQQLHKKIIMSITVNILKDLGSLMQAFCHNPHGWIWQELHSIPVDEHHQLVNRWMEGGWMESEGSSSIEFAVSLRLQCLLIGVIGYKPVRQHIEALITQLQQEQHHTHDTIKFGWCFLLLCPQLARLCSESAIVSLLQQFCASPHPEVLLLCGLEFHSGNSSAVADHVSSFLQTSVVFHQESLSAFSDLVCKTIPEQQLVKRVLQLHVEVGISSSFPALSLQCMHHVLNHKLLNQYKLEPAHWFTSTIESCCIPMQPRILNIVEQLVELFIESKMIAFPVTHIMDSFYAHPNSTPDWSTKPTIATSSMLVPQVLYVYCCLCIYKRVGCGKFNESVMPEWKLPVQRILQHLSSNPKPYQPVYSKLLVLASHCMPQLWTLWLDRLQAPSIRYYAATLASSCTKLPQPDKVMLAVQRLPQRQTQCCSMLNQLLVASQSQLICYMQSLQSIVIQVVAHEQNLSATLLQITYELWKRFEHFNCTWICFTTTLCLVTTPLQHIELVKQPLQVVQKIRISAAHNSILLPMILHCLYFYIQANWSWHNWLGFAGSTTKKQQLQISLQLQNTAIAQDLLHWCEDDLVQADSKKLTCVQRDICWFLDQMFFHNIELVHLVHQQGYQQHLIEMSINHICSLHQCVDMLPQLLAKPAHPRKQAFRMDLVAHFLMKYPSDYNQLVGTSAMQPLTTLIEDGAQQPFVDSCVLSFIKLVDVCPILLPHCINLLEKVKATINIGDAKLTRVEKRLLLAKIETSFLHLAAIIRKHQCIPDHSRAMATHGQ